MSTEATILGCISINSQPKHPPKKYRNPTTYISYIKHLTRWRDTQSSHGNSGLIELRIARTNHSHWQPQSMLYHLVQPTIKWLPTHAIRFWGQNIQKFSNSAILFNRSNVEIGSATYTSLTEAMVARGHGKKVSAANNLQQACKWIWKKPMTAGFRMQPTLIDYKSGVTANDNTEAYIGCTEQASDLRQRQRQELIQSCTTPRQKPPTFLISFGD